MVSWKLRNRSYSLINQADSDHSENVEGTIVNCCASHCEVTVRENPATEKEEQSANTVVMSNNNVTICTDSSVDRNGMFTSQLQETLTTLMQTIQSEHCKLTAALEAKLTESNKQSAEIAKQIAVLEAKLTAESSKKSAESAKADRSIRC
jgi:hypothetical protein